MPAHALVRSRARRARAKGLEQHQAAIGTGVRQVEASHHGFRESLALEGHLRHTVCSHRGSSSACLEVPEQRFYSTREWLGGSCLSSFSNFPARWWGFRGAAFLRVVSVCSNSP